MLIHQHLGAPQVQPPPQTLLLGPGSHPQLCRACYLGRFQDVCVGVTSTLLRDGPGPFLSSPTCRLPQTQARTGTAAGRRSPACPCRPVTAVLTCACAARCAQDGAEIGVEFTTEPQPVGKPETSLAGESGFTCRVGGGSGVVGAVVRFW